MKQTGRAKLCVERKECLFDLSLLDSAQKMDARKTKTTMWAGLGWAWIWTDKC
jgi:hypothetical protein